MANRETYNPTPAEIAEATARFRDQWEPQEAKRRGIQSVPVADLDERRISTRDLRAAAND